METKKMSDFKEKGLERVISLGRACYQCSTCTGGCPVFRNNPEINPRLVIAKPILDGVEEFPATLNAWNCCLCLTCNQRCPQAVDLAHLLIILRNLSVHEGNTPAGVLDEIKMLIQTGMTQKASKMIQSRRKRLKLPEILYPDLTEIQKKEIYGFNGNGIPIIYYT
ncbi:MAG: 4Fe-4S dicluster domain-containing protein [Candidatus Hermodarchaeota archaeon]